MGRGADDESKVVEDYVDVDLHSEVAVELSIDDFGGLTLGITSLVWLLFHERKFTLFFDHTEDCFSVVFHVMAKRSTLRFIKLMEEEAT